MCGTRWVNFQFSTPRVRKSLPGGAEDTYWLYTLSSTSSYSSSLGMPSHLGTYTLRRSRKSGKENAHVPTVFQIEVAKMFGTFSSREEAKELSPNVVRVSCGYCVVKSCSVYDGFWKVWVGRCEGFVGSGNLLSSHSFSLARNA